MAISKYDEVTKQLKQGDIKNLYYFYGLDIMSVEALTKLVKGKLVKKGDEAYNFTSLNGKKLDLNELSEIAQTYPMLADYKCITINDLNMEDIIGDNTKIFMNILSDIPPTTVIVIYITGFDIKGGKKTTTAKNKKLIDFISKNGVVCEMNIKTSFELGASIEKKTASYGCKISKQNAIELANLCLCNSMLISNELQKLCAYVNGGEITYEVLQNLVSRQLDTDAFSLARAVTEFNGIKALKLLDEIMTLRAEPIAVLTAISMAFSDLYKAKLAMTSYKREKDVAEDFSYRGREFVIRNAFRDSRNISLEHLKVCNRILMETDLYLKSSKTDGRLLLETAIVKMIKYKTEG